RFSRDWSSDVCSSDLHHASAPGASGHRIVGVASSAARLNWRQMVSVHGEYGRVPGTRMDAAPVFRSAHLAARSPPDRIPLAVDIDIGRGIEGDRGGPDMHAVSSIAHREGRMTHKAACFDIHFPGLQGIVRK